MQVLLRQRHGANKASNFDGFGCQSKPAHALLWLKLRLVSWRSAIINSLYIYIIFQTLRVFASWSFKNLISLPGVPRNTLRPVSGSSVLLVRAIWQDRGCQVAIMSHNLPSETEWNLSQTWSFSQGVAATVLRHHSVRVPVRCGDLGTFRDQRRTRCGDGVEVWRDVTGWEQDTTRRDQNVQDALYRTGRCGKSMEIQYIGKRNLQKTGHSHFETQKRKFNWKAAHVEIAAGQKNRLWTLKCVYFSAYNELQAACSRS